jgi:hypothetical protein
MPAQLFNKGVMAGGVRPLLPEVCRRRHEGLAVCSQARLSGALYVLAGVGCVGRVGSTTTPGRLAKLVDDCSSAHNAGQMGQVGCVRPLVAVCFCRRDVGVAQPGAQPVVLPAMAPVPRPALQH